MVAVVGGESAPLVQRHGCGVALLDLQVQAADAACGSRSGQRRSDRQAQSSAAVIGMNLNGGKTTPAAAERESADRDRRVAVLDSGEDLSRCREQQLPGDRR